MSTSAPCQAYVLGEVLALIDGAVSEAGGMTCDERPSATVLIRRPGWNLLLDVCEPHRVVISLGVVGYVRST